MDNKNMTLDEIIKRDRAAARQGRGGRGGFRKSQRGGGHMVPRSRGGIFKRKNEFQTQRGGGFNRRGGRSDRMVRFLLH